MTRRARLGGSFLDRDLAPLVLAVIPAADAGRRVRLIQRAGLLAVALAQLAITVPLLILGHDHGAGAHAAHELGSFDVALAIAFAVGAIRPALSAGRAWAGTRPAAGQEPGFWLDGSPDSGGGGMDVARGSGGSDGMARGIAVGGVVIGLLGLALGGISWRRGKAAGSPVPALDGDDLAMSSAAKPAQEPRNDRESRRPGTAARDASRRKSASSRTTRR